MLHLQIMSHIQDALRIAGTVAVVGFSPKENRPSNQVGRYLVQAGFRVVPVNPGHDEICGLLCYPDLGSIPYPVDVVNIFRRSQEVMPVVIESIAIKAKVIWMQEGVVNTEAAKLAKNAGLLVIMDRCIKMDHIQFSQRKTQTK